MNQENNWPSFLASVGIHAVVVLLILFSRFLLPSNVVRLGSGAGGGTGGDISTVGIIDDLSGGAGMVKPSLVPKPPVLEKKIKPQDESKAIPLPKTVELKSATKEIAKNTKPIPRSNMIPTAPEPGSGGIGGRSGGSGGGIGGGNGISIGPGSGGFGNSAYARTVEDRIGRNWTHPPEGIQVEIVYSFYILPNGTVTGIKQEKSSGNPSLDMYAERAIRLLNSPSNPLPLPPLEYRTRPIQFMAQFIYPPN